MPIININLYLVAILIDTTTTKKGSIAGLAETNEIFSRISALASKKSSNQRNSVKETK